MKKSIVYSFAVCAMVSLYACQGSSTHNGTRNDSTGINEAPPNSAANRDMNKMPDTSKMAMGTVDDKTHHFMDEAAMGGNMEVQLGKLAEEKAMNPRVKAFGEMMVRDHTEVNGDLKTIANQKSVTLPEDMGKHQDSYTDLSKKSGEDFDKAYMKMMVDDHKKDIDEFEKIANTGTDPDVKTFASQKLPIIRRHLDSAKAIDKILK